MTIGRLRWAVFIGVALAMVASLSVPAPASANQDAGGVTLARAVFAPGTDPGYAGEVLSELTVLEPRGLQLAQVGTHWNPSSTALNNGGGAPGDSLELTWSIIPDGTLMPAQGGFDTTCTSNLIATFDSVYSAGVWQAELQAVWDDWTAMSGNVYTPAVALDADGTPIDDGASWPSSAGVAGVRGDVRIGGCTIDGDSGVLAYNFFPSTGDMKIDATDSFYATRSITPWLHNVLSHEHGHGVGLGHVCPVDGTKLMEPYINGGFLGLQHDDLRGIQRGYGDRFELINNPNDSQGAATPLTPVGGQTENTLSLDSTGDTDWFQFGASAGDLVDVTVSPNGLTYLEGNDPGSNGCASSSPTALNSLALQDLSFEIRDGAGVLTTVDAGGAGSVESIANFAIATTGTHYIRVLGSGIDDSQLYDLFVDQSADTSDPQVTITTPADGASFELGAMVTADFECIDEVGGSGIASCVGDVVDGEPVDTATLGPKSFTVTGTDFAGNSSGVTHNYTVVSAPVKIGNRVWEDLNGDGRQNSGEPSIAAVTIELLDATNTVTQTTTTNTNGNWTLSVDATPSWQIRVVAPTGLTFTTQNTGTNDNTDSDADPTTGIITIPAGTLTPATPNHTFDAGIIDPTKPPLATIGNRVWEDLNGDGRQNSGEPSIAAVTIELLDATNTVTQTTTTNTNGNWTLSVDATPSWQIRVVAPTGLTFTTQNTGTNDNTDSDADPTTGIITIPAGTLTPATPNHTFDAGIIDPTKPPLATIGNRVWEDLNGDGRQNSGEPSIAAVTIELLDATNTVTQTTTTNTNGNWTLSVDATPSWQIRVVAPTGLTFTTQNTGTNDNTDSDADPTTGIITIPAGTLTPATPNHTFDAGIIDPTKPPLATIGNRVWEDLNGDGRQNSGEPSIAAVTIELLDATNTVTQTTTTNTNGNWTLSVDATPSWQIRVVAPTGLTFTTQNTGTNDNTDSDADPTTGIITIPAGTLTPATPNHTFDAGIIDPTT